MSVRTTKEGLKLFDEARNRRGWKLYRWCQEANVSSSTLKRFRAGTCIKEDSLSSIFGAVGIDNWQEFAEPCGMQNRYPINYWESVPDVSVFYGRTQELEDLEQWIVRDGCRLISICGMVGMGKTTLAAKLGDRIQDRFQYLIWRSLRSTPAPSVQDLLKELIQLLSEEPEPDLPDNLDNLITCLIKYLCKYRILLVFDNLETILRPGDFAGHYLEGYRSYGELFRRIGQEDNQSCLLLTTREKIGEVSIYGGETLPVRSLDLDSLGEAGEEIFRAKGLSGKEYWKQLIRYYRGNPLMLKIVSTSIKELFHGNVGEFFSQNKSRRTWLVGDIGHFLQQQFDRLTKPEKQIMEHLAVAEELVSLLELQQTLENIYPCDIQNALQSLMRRSLVESNTEGFTLQPAIREYVVYRLGEPTN
jgi:hypothetical protein